MAATIIAIGDELLAGYTLDSNSNWMAQRLRRLGHPLKRVTQVRDREAEIVEQVRRDLADPEVSEVFCSGGLGPTPDDRTFAALASALGRELVEEESVRERIERRLERMKEAGLVAEAELNEGHLRMARIPAGATAGEAPPRGSRGWAATESHHTPPAGASAAIRSGSPSWTASAPQASARAIAPLVSIRPFAMTCTYRPPVSSRWSRRAAAASAIALASGSRMPITVSVVTTR